ncbi:hypothetical protein C0Z18_24840 [Trinickia dabaoshanensis]|uniref:Uncharacterized protein n=1 Tax=Trinickia dabaoshanensis TaxID=564714 RepID=A0A2N7VFQ5_9BURK|nr:hypothetical protein C0Z18_24840 [Trinickia dabaoshanensis]
MGQRRTDELAREPPVIGKVIIWRQQKADGKRSKSEKNRVLASVGNLFEFFCGRRKERLSQALQTPLRFFCRFTSCHTS